MPMETSILKSTKKILGLVDDETAFDHDVLTHVNSAFSNIYQIGLGPPGGFFLDDDTTTWNDLNLPPEQLNLLRTYMSLKVRMLFDPPTTSFHIEAMERQIDEHFIRLSYYREEVVTDDSESPQHTEASSGTQSTPSTIWIMNHNLGFNPAGFRFTTLDGLDELEPESITYVTVNRTLASWPTAIAGKWVVS